MTDYANKLDLLNKSATRRYKDVEVPGFGVFRIQSLSELERSTLDDVEDKNDRAAAIVLCLVDADGLRLFADHEIELVAGLDASVVRTLYEEILSHVLVPSEELEKNSEPGSDNSQSG